MVKILGSADLVRSVLRAGVPVFAEFHGGKDNTAMLVDTRSASRTPAPRRSTFATRPARGKAVARGRHPRARAGLGGGPWLDGRMRLALAAIGISIHRSSSTRTSPRLRAMR